MSWRSSYATEYIYCRDCFQATKAALEGFILKRDSRYPVQELYESILFGFVKGGWMGEEALDFEMALEGEKFGLCHEVRVVLIPEGGRVRVFRLKPDKKPRKK